MDGPPATAIEIPDRETPIRDELAASVERTVNVFTRYEPGGLDLRALMGLVEVGSRHLNEVIDPDTFDGVLNARLDFFEQKLGWGDEANVLRDAYVDFSSDHTYLIPLDTFVRSQNAMSELGLDGIKLIKSHPKIIGLSAESIRAKMDNFAQLGLDGVKIVNALPALIGLSPEGVRAKMDNFAQLGLDGVKIVNSLPAAISLSQQSVQAKMDNFAQLGLDGVKIVNALPTVISYSPDNIKIKINALKEVGLITGGQDLPLDSITQISKFFITPIESLLLYASQEKSQNVDLGRVGYLARQYATSKLAATSHHERTRRYLESLPELYDSLGQVAIDHANYIKLPKTGIELAGRDY